jgi:hypothetical protein
LALDLCPQGRRPAFGLITLLRLEDFARVIQDA